MAGWIGSALAKKGKPGQQSTDLREAVSNAPIMKKQKSSKHAVPTGGPASASLPPLRKS